MTPDLLALLTIGSGCFGLVCTAVTTACSFHNDPLADRCAFLALVSFSAFGFGLLTLIQAVR